MPHARFAAGLTVLVLSGCGGDSPVGDRFIVRDSAGIQVAWSSTPRISETVVVDPDPTTVITSDFGAPDHILFNARYATQLSDGRLVVGNTGTNELLFFSAAGDFLDALGAPGDGPGEFQRLFGLHECDADVLVVEELSRLSIINGESPQFVRNVQVAGHLAATRGVLAGVDPSCSSALMVDQVPPTIGAENRVLDASVSFYWADFTTGARDSVGTFLSTELYPWQIQGRRIPMRAPFGRNSVWALHAEGLVFGSARDMSFELLGDDGSTLRIVQWAAPLLPVTDEAWEDFERSREDFVRENPAEAELQPPRGYFPRPEQQPPYSALQVDDSGRVWVRNYTGYSVYGPEPSSAWWVFSSEGEWLADVRLPDGLEVLHIGDSTLVGVVLDDVDLEQIQVHHFDLQE